MGKAAIPNSTRVNVIVPNQTLKIAKFLAGRRGTTYSELIRVALTSYLRDELLKEREADERIEELGLRTEDEYDNGTVTAA
jgi:hypothetical protein